MVMSVLRSSGPVHYSRAAPMPSNLRDDTARGDKYVESVGKLCASKLHLVRHRFKELQRRLSIRRIFHSKVDVEIEVLTGAAARAGECPLQVTFILCQQPPDSKSPKVLVTQVNIEISCYVHNALHERGLADQGKAIRAFRANAMYQPPRRAGNTPLSSVNPWKYISTPTYFLQSPDPLYSSSSQCFIVTECKSNSPLLRRYHPVFATWLAAYFPPQESFPKAATA